MRDSNNVGQPAGGVGPSLASQGFVTGIGTPGIVPLAPSIEGIENVIFNSFVMGTPITNLKQWNNTYAANDSFSKVLGDHTFKAGVEARATSRSTSIRIRPSMARSSFPVRKPAWISRTS